MGERGKVQPCQEEPCAACPWRVSNRGKPSPKVEGERFGWYTPQNLKRLWGGLREGDPMTCHPTDPAMRQANGGYVKPETVTYECTGATILQQREFQIAEDYLRGKKTINDYRRERPKGLSKTGIRAIAERLIFGGVPMIGGAKMGRPDLNQEDVQYAPLGVWEPRE